MGYTITIISEEAAADEATATAAEQAALAQAKTFAGALEGVQSAEFIGDYVGYHDLGEA